MLFEKSVSITSTIAAGGIFLVSDVAAGYRRFLLAQNSNLSCSLSYYIPIWVYAELHSVNFLAGVASTFWHLCYSCR